MPHSLGTAVFLYTHRYQVNTGISDLGSYRGCDVSFSVDLLSHYIRLDSSVKMAWAGDLKGAISTLRQSQVNLHVGHHLVESTMYSPGKVNVRQVVYVKFGCVVYIIYSLM